MSETIGQQLLVARVTRGLEIEDVAHHTRVHRDMLLLLESDDYAAFPNSMFARSFLKIYGEFIGVDTRPAVAQLAAAASHHGEQYLLGGIDPAIREHYGHLTSRFPVRPVLASILALLAIMVGGSYLVSHLYGSGLHSLSDLANLGAEFDPAETDGEGDGDASPPPAGDEGAGERLSPPAAIIAAPSPPPPDPGQFPPLAADFPRRAPIDLAAIPKAAPVVKETAPVEGLGSDGAAEAEDAGDEEPDPATASGGAIAED